MDKVITEVEGMDAVIAHFHRALDLTKTAAFAYAMYAVGNLMKDVMITATPVRGTEYRGGSSLEEGELRSGIRLKVEVQQDTKVGLAVVSWGQNGHVAVWVEYGHRLLYHGKSKKTRQEIPGPPVPPKPFARPAAEAAIDAIWQEFSDALVEGLMIEGILEQVA